MSSQPANDLSLSTSTSPFNGRNSATPSSPTSQQRPPFYARFSRRPRTSSNANQSPFAASTSNLLASSNGGSGFASLIRSSSSSQVHLPSPTDHATTASPERNASRTSRISFQTRLSSPNLDSIPQASTMTSTNASATNASSGAGGGGTGSALGRMFRRYSQSGNARSESQRSTTRDRDSFNMPRNTSSPALDRDTGSPMRVSTNSAVASPALARSGSHAANLSTPISGDTTAAITGSRTLASIPSASAAASPASGSPAVAAGATASTQTQTASQDANSAPRPTQTTPEAASTDAAAPGASASPASTRPLNGMHRIRLVPHLEATRSLHFEPIERDLKEGAGAVKVGRFTDRQPSQRDPIASTLAGVVNEATSSGEFGTLAAPAQSTRGQPGARGGAIPISGSHGGGGRIDSSRIAFKSKVVSRGHAEIWCEPGGKFFIRDTKSSSGTFLNHIRLSGPNLESKPFAIKDGDVVQLGVDYQGGTEEIYRCVKMRVELNRGWQREANQFNVNAFRQLRALQGTPLSPPTEDKGKVASTALPTNRQSVSVTDCCICLFSVTVCQALFIAPCSHVFHYKCIRPLLNLHHPGFSCPLCRTFADLDADVEEDEAWQVALEQEAAAAEARLALGKQPLEVGTPAVELDAPIAAAMAPTLTTALLNGDVGRESTAPRLPFTATASPLLADLQTGHAAPPRGTAALSRRKNDWARPDTAVGSSAGPLAGDETFAVMESHAETAGLSAELGEMMVTDRLLNENPAANVGTAASLHRAAHGASETGSPLRRGSGPIAIGNSDRAMHGQRATPSSSALTGPAAQGSLDEGWPTVGTVGGFSPGLDESGTPLNSTFLSTLAEAPQVGSANHSPSSGRDFPPGRSAPAKTPVPAIITAGTSRPRLGEDGANDAQFADPVGARTKRSSGEGGEDVDTAEEEMGGPATFGGATLGSSGGAGPAKGKAKVDGQTLTFAGDVHHDLVKTGDGSVQVPHKVGGQATPASGDFGAKSTGVRGYSRSRSRSRSGRDAMQSDSDDQEAAPFQSYELPPVPRTGPNLNASAYMHNSPGGQSHSGNGGSARQTGGNGGNAENVSSPASPASESKMARLKRRISHAM